MSCEHENPHEAQSSLLLLKVCHLVTGMLHIYAIVSICRTRFMTFDFVRTGSPPYNVRDSPLHPNNMKTRIQNIIYRNRNKIVSLANDKNIIIKKADKVQANFLKNLKILLPKRN